MYRLRASVDNAENLFESVNPVIQELTNPLFVEKSVRLFVQREDRLHSYISGNKWRKLRYNIEAFLNSGRAVVVSFGGAYSNHIHALAYAGKLLGIKSVGIIRGDELMIQNPMLKQASEWGMQLYFVSREAYRNKETIDLHAVTGVLNDEMFVIPEGAANEEGIKGCEEIVKDQNNRFNYICVAAGTGTTAAGMGRALENDVKMLVFPAIKGAVELEHFVRKGIKENVVVEFKTDFHFGGYGKVKPELIRFMEEFEAEYHIPLEPVYTGKMFYGIHRLIEDGYFPKGADILVIHTGGLQGNRGYSERQGLYNS